MLPGWAGLAKAASLRAMSVGGLASRSPRQYLQNPCVPKSAVWSRFVPDVPKRISLPAGTNKNPPSLLTGGFVLISMPDDLPASSEPAYSSSSSGIGLRGGGGRLPIVTVSSVGLPRRITFIFASAPGFSCAIALSRAVVSEID